MKIRHFNALEDNYMYLITDDNSKECAVVDPAEPAEVRKRQLVSSILVDSFDLNL